MSKEGEHSKILAAAAQRVLSPLGFWRKGRSRVWLADRAFWLCIVEFQPSGFSKGSFLNVAAHWLWTAMPDSLSFDYSLPGQKPWIAFDGDAARFRVVAGELVQRAALESEELRTRIANFSTLAKLLASEEIAYEKEGRGGGWTAFHAAMISGVSGNMPMARKFLSSAIGSMNDWSDVQARLIPYSKAVKNKTSFRQFITHKVNEQRRTFGLDTYRFER